MKAMLHSRDDSSKGAALIIALAFVVLLTGVTLAYFSRATTSTQLAQSSLSDIKADLLAGGHRLIGGPPATRRLAAEWVRMKEAEQRELVTLKPSFWGVSIDLKETWRRLARRFRAR